MIRAQEPLVARISSEVAKKWLLGATGSATVGRPASRPAGDRRRDRRATGGRTAHECIPTARSMGRMTQAADGVTAETVRDAVFAKPSMGKRGYDEKSVNDFLQLVARRLDGRGHLSADDVRHIRFPKCAVFKRGYDATEVDGFMARVADAIETLGEP